jgi:hypothetical protein
MEKKLPRKIENIKEVRALAANLLYVCDNVDIQSIQWWSDYRTVLEMLSDRKYK